MYFGAFIVIFRNRNSVSVNIPSNVVLIFLVHTKSVLSVGVLRSKSDLDWVPSTPNRGDNGMLTTTLRVSRMTPSGRQENASPEEQRQGFPGESLKCENKYY